MSKNKPQRGTIPTIDTPGYTVPPHGEWTLGQVATDLSHRLDLAEQAVEESLLGGEGLHTLGSGIERSLAVRWLAEGLPGG